MPAIELQPCDYTHNLFDQSETPYRDNPSLLCQTPSLNDLILAIDYLGGRLRDEELDEEVVVAQALAMRNPKIKAIIERSLISYG